MSMEEKNNIVKNFIINISNNLNQQIPNFINEEKINKAIEMYSNSEKDIETIQNEITELVNKMIEEYKEKRNKPQEKHYELNDFFNCRISNNTLHIHVVPESIKADIAKLGLREYYKFIDEKLKDALSKIPVILQMPDNQNINTVFAVSPLLRTKESQEIFRKYGFDASISTEEKFVEMFDGKRIGQASISRDKFLSMYQNQEQQMIENINSALSSNFMIEMLKREWDKGHNISSLGNLIGEAYNHIIINKDGYGFETYMNKMEELYFKLHSHQISPEEFQIEKAKSISFIIAQKLNIDTTKEIASSDEEKIKQYFLNEYVKNGYVSHSFPEVYKNSIMENGLIADPGLRSSSSNEIQEIQELFMSKGIARPLGGYPYYGGTGIYYEHDFTKVFQHVINAPEWFNWFTSSDHSKGFQGIEQSPYILRDETACRRNILDLCSNSGLSREETEKVVKFYSETYEKFSSPTLNVGLISKSVVGKNDVLKTVPRNLPLIDTIITTMTDSEKQYTEHVGNVSHETISPEHIKITNIPSANKLMTVSEYSRETKEHLTNPDTNLAMIERAEQVKSRMTPRMIQKTEETKAILMQKKSEQKSFNSSLENRGSTKPISVKKGPKVKSSSFTRRNESEIQVASQIKEKNATIQKQKEQQRNLNKPKVKTLTKPTNPSSGYTNVITLSLIVSFVAGILCTIVYLILNR